MTIKWGKAFAPKNASEAYQRNLKALVATLKGQSVEKVRMDFYGSGDSGSFENPTYYANGETCWDFDSVPGSATLLETMVEVWRPQGLWSAVTKGYTETIDKVSLPVPEAVKAVFEDYVNDQSVDWYNNDGGSGYAELTLSGSVPTFECSIDVNITTSHNEHYEEMVVE